MIKSKIFIHSNKLDINDDDHHDNHNGVNSSDTYVSFFAVRDADMKIHKPYNLLSLHINNGITNTFIDSSELNRIRFHHNSQHT